MYISLSILNKYYDYICLLLYDIVNYIYLFHFSLLILIKIPFIINIIIENNLFK